MANPIFTFTIDAEAILAKLHLAGKSQAPNYLVINSAVSNDSSGTPENPGSTKFDLGAKDGKYEVCLVKTGFEYTEQLDINTDPEIAKIRQELDDADSKTSKAEKNEKDTVDKQKLTDDNSKVDAEHKKSNDASKAVLKFNKQYVSRLKELGLKGLNDTSTDEEIEKAIKKENETRAKAKDEALNAAKKDALKEIKAYFLTFAGKESSAQINENSVVVLQMPEKCKSSSDVKIEKFRILGIDKKEQEEWKEKYLEDQTKPAVMNIGFKVGYEIHAF